MINRILSEDTIAALVTPVGGSVCVIRISGGGVLCVLKKVFKGNTENFESHKVYYGHIADASEVIDEVLVTVMLAPRSFTREDVVEIGCHGGAAAVEAVFALILRSGARLAEPGEFTKRAFLNGRIDLAQAEAAADLVAAKTDAARRSALGRLGGGLSSKVKRITGALLAVLARIEAAIDYPEEVDSGRENGTLLDLCAEIGGLLGTYGAGRVVKDGIGVVILGRPNVGKSSLLNALLYEERAIVTSVAGTTRDVLREQAVIGGIPVNLIDTAGIRETNDCVERAGVERAENEARAADLVLYVTDGEIDAEIIALIDDGGGLPGTAHEPRGVPPLGGTPRGRRLKAAAEPPETSRVRRRGGAGRTDCGGHEGSRVGTPATDASAKCLAVINKTDIMSESEITDIRNDLARLGFNDGNTALISAKNGAGVEALKQLIQRLFLSGDVDYESGIITTERHKFALEAALAHIENAVNAAQNALPEDFISIDLTAAYHCLCEITGESVSDALIDKIFSEFCLGK